MNIVVVGAGYVGMATALALARTTSHVVIVDNDPTKVRAINERRSPIENADMEDALLRHHISASTDLRAVAAAADYVVVAVPTDLDPKTTTLDTSAVEGILAEVLSTDPFARIIIRSTVPLGFTDSLIERYPRAAISFVPEFLRARTALSDELRPSRIVVGPDSLSSREFVAIMQEAVSISDVPTVIATAIEAEAIKLFSNA